MSCWQLGKAVHFQSPIVERSKQAATSIHTSESFLPLLWALTLESWEWPWALLTTRNYSAGLERKKEEEKQQEESSRPLTNRKKTAIPSRAGLVSFPQTLHTHQSRSMCECDTYLLTMAVDRQDKNRMKVLSSALHMGCDESAVVRATLVQECVWKSGLHPRAAI